VFLVAGVGALVDGRLSVSECVAQLGGPVVDVRLERVSPQRQALERGVGDDHRVPVPGRGAGDELLPAPGPRQVAGRDQHAGLGVELEQLPAELLPWPRGGDRVGDNTYCGRP
jgi:hypothetical protein